MIRLRRRRRGALSQIAAGSVWLLTTRTEDGLLRTRPVTVVAVLPERLVMVTGADATKLTQIRRDPQVSIAGPVAGGWLALEASATVHEAPAKVRALLRTTALPLPDHGLAAIVARPSRARRWQVLGPEPWNNECQELPLA